WITDAYTLCFAALLVPAGALGDRYGRRLSLIGGLAPFPLRSNPAALSSGTGVLIGPRVVMGLGAAFVMPATLSILNSVFPPKERPQAIAAWSAVAGVGIVIGPTLGGLLLTHFWWGSVFLINVPLVALALAGVLLTVPETAEPGGHRLDIPGTLLVAGALFAIAHAIIEAPTRGWTSAATLAETVAGLAALGVFVWWELRIEHPLIDLRVFAVRAFSTAAASVTVIFFALFGSLFVLTQYLQLVHGYSPLSAGVRALPFAFAMAAASPLSPVLAKRLGARVVIPAGMARMGLGLLDLSTAGVHTAYLPIAIAVAVMGAGMGLVMAPASTIIMTTVPAHQAGAGSAINDTIREVGGALGVAIVGSMAAAVYRSRLGSVLPTAQHAPGQVIHQATSSVAAADIIGRHVGGVQGSQLVSAAHSAFVTAMATGIRVAAAVALVSAIGAIFALPRRPEPEPVPRARPLSRCSPRPAEPRPGRPWRAARCSPNRRDGQGLPGRPAGRLPGRPAVRRPTGCFAAQQRVDEGIPPVAVLEPDAAQDALPPEAGPFEGFLLGDVSGVGQCFQPVRGRVAEQVLHQQPLRLSAEPAAPVPGHQREADLVAGPWQAAAVAGGEAGNPGYCPIRQDDGERGAFRRDPPVLLPAVPAPADVHEAGPLEEAKGVRVGAQPVQERKVVLAKSSQGHPVTGRADASLCLSFRHADCVYQTSRDAGEAVAARRYRSSPPPARHCW